MFGTWSGKDLNGCEGNRNRFDLSLFLMVMLVRKCHPAAFLKLSQSLLPNAEIIFILI